MFYIVLFSVFGFSLNNDIFLIQTDKKCCVPKPFVAQYNPRRATQRRKPEIMTSVAKQQFDRQRFNFSKIDDSKELLFNIFFEEDGDKVLLIAVKFTYVTDNVSLIP